MYLFKKHPPTLCRVTLGTYSKVSVGNLCICNSSCHTEKGTQLFAPFSKCVLTFLVSLQCLHLFVYTLSTLHWSLTQSQNLVLSKSSSSFNLCQLSVLVQRAIDKEPSSPFGILHHQPMDSELAFPEMSEVISKPRRARNS